MQEVEHDKCVLLNQCAEKVSQVLAVEVHRNIANKTVDIGRGFIIIGVRAHVTKTRARKVFVHNLWCDIPCTASRSSSLFLLLVFILFVSCLCK